MTHIWWIEEIWHCEIIGKYKTYSEARNKINELSKLPWWARPNLPPCGSKTCLSYEYEIIEYDTSIIPYKLIKRELALIISKNEVKLFIDNNL